MSNDVIRLLTSFDAASLQTLLVVRAMAARSSEGTSGNEMGVVPHDIAVIAETLGVTPSTLRRRLTSLDEYVKFEGGRITTFPLDHQAIMHAFYKWRGSEPAANVSASDVMRRWSERYAERYGTKYSYGTQGRFFAAKATAAKFAATYGDDALALIDAIIDNYDAMWKSGDYPRPTFGGITWMGEKAMPFVMRQRCDTKRDETDYDRNDDDGRWEGV